MAPLLSRTCLLSPSLHCDRGRCGMLRVFNIRVLWPQRRPQSPQQRNLRLFRPPASRVSALESSAEATRGVSLRPRPSRTTQPVHGPRSTGAASGCRLCGIAELRVPLERATVPPRRFTRLQGDGLAPTPMNRLAPSAFVVASVWWPLMMAALRGHSQACSLARPLRRQRFPGASERVLPHSPWHSKV